MKNNKKIWKYSIIVLIVAVFLGVIFGISAKNNSQEIPAYKTEDVRLEDESDISVADLEDKVVEAEKEKFEDSTSEESKDSLEEKDVLAADESKDSVEEPNDEDVEKNISTKSTEEEPEFSDIDEDVYEFHPLDTDAGITVLAVEGYDGKYVEDSSDESVSGVMALYVKNIDKKEIQLADLKVQDSEGNTYEFRITTLLPGQEMFVLEKNRAKYEDGMKIISASTVSLGVFAESPSLHEDVFEITTENNRIILKNISDEKVLAARVYYKNVLENIYIGGITYMASFQEILPGKSVELVTRHYTKDASEVVFVTYAK